MEKSKSFPQYSSSYSSEFGFQDEPNSYTFNGPSSKGQGFTAPNDPELKRKKRIAAYNMFTTEGKLKATVRESFKWVKTKLTDEDFSFAGRDATRGPGLATRSRSGKRNIADFLPSDVNSTSRSVPIV
ncbi:hypothetical protein ACH5RR_034370 [Cinchona calisaya]|uniref:Uncharacterized protein n=1 Tax=Cinchona calisaya TaxID=153742 RepID=A0ABD2YEB2_9GENT